MSISINSKLKKKLINVARSGEVITYEPVMEVLGLKIKDPRDRTKLNKMLDAISAEEKIAGRPLLSAVVVHNDSKGFPGDGFFHMARREGVFAGGESDETFHRAELKRIYDHWCNKPSYWFENYWPVENRRESLGVWFHKEKLIHEEDVQVGDRVVFYETLKGGGAEAVFACGRVISNELEPIPIEYRFSGGKQWTGIKLVEPEFNLDPKNGVPLRQIEKIFGSRIRGLIRQGTQLTEDDYRKFENLLKEKQLGLNSQEVTTRNQIPPQKELSGFRAFNPREVGQFKPSGLPVDPAAETAAQERASRSHEEIRKALGTLVASKGILPEDHPNVDLRAIYKGIEWFFEVKSCDSKKFAGQIRSGVSQLLEYRYRFGTEDTRLCLVTQVPPPETMKWSVVEYLGKLKIALCWQTENGFSGPQGNEWENFFGV